MRMMIDTNDMNRYDTELDKTASCNLQFSLYSLSHFNTLKVMSHLAILMIYLR